MVIARKWNKKSVNLNYFFEIKSIELIDKIE